MKLLGLAIKLDPSTTCTRDSHDPCRVTVQDKSQRFRSRRFLVFSMISHVNTVSWMMNSEAGCFRWTFGGFGDILHACRLSDSESPTLYNVSEQLKRREYEFLAILALF